MKKTAYLLLVTIIIATVMSFTVHADDPADTPFPLQIDDLSNINGITSPDAAVTRIIYTDDEKYLSSGEDDGGYISVRRSNCRSGDPLGFSLKLDSAVNLYSYTNLCFYYNIPEPTYYTENNASILQYILTVTLKDENTEYTTRISAEPGGWNLAEIPVRSWNGRANLTDISISLTAVYSSADMIGLELMVDSVTADIPADTTIEDTFMSTSFSASGGTCNYNNETNTLEWSTSSAASSITGTAIFESQDEIAGHNTLRITFSATDDVKLKLLFSYRDGTGTIGEAYEIAKTDSVNSLYVDLPNAKDLKNFSLSAEAPIGTLINVYNIDTLYLPDLSADTAPPAEGTLETCTLNSDGSINLRGSIPSDIVADNLKGSLFVYAIPLYANIEEYIAENPHTAEAAMSTRYNITIPEKSLPYGYAASLYAVFVKSGDELIMIGTPTLPDTKNAGVADERNKSIKGIISDSLTAADNAAVTEITLDLSLLFDDTSSGRMYSSFGRLYYFNTEYLKKLDAKIKSLSLSGTDIYIRLVETSDVRTRNSDVAYIAVAADTEDEFASLYSAVDFITDRYSSSEYGYISGIIIGNSPNDPHPNAKTPNDYAISAVKTAAAVYGAASANILDFRILLPFGDHYVDPVLSDNGDAELTLTLFSHYAEIYGLMSYGILWQTDSVPEMGAIGIRNIQDLKNRLDSIDGITPSYITVEHTTLSQYYYAAEAVYDYMSAYYAACETSSVSSFIFRFATPLQGSLWDEFVRYYSIIDTDNIVEVENYLKRNLGTPPVAAEGARVRAYPFTYLKNNTTDKSPENILGVYKLFDYTNSFDTGGWFTVGVNGECITVKSDSGRAMRAVGGGIMYSAPTPLDLSGSPVISIDAYSNEKASYKFVLYSKKGVYETTFKTTEYSSAVYIDISEFKGSDSVYGILILPETVSPTLYVSSISCHSFDLTDTELSEFFESSNAASATVTEPETNVVELLAFIFVVVVLSAAVFSAMRRKEN